jgi:hypothetical protein
MPRLLHRLDCPTGTKIRVPMIRRGESKLRWVALPASECTTKGQYPSSRFSGNSDRHDQRPNSYRHAPPVNKVLRNFGLVACFVSLLTMSGTQWVALQSVAWTRMLIQFAQADSFASAVVKTFDGYHRCSLCLRAQAGFAQEQQPARKLPLLKFERLPEYFWQFRQWTTLSFLPPLTTGPIPFVGGFYIDFFDAPATPPPRLSIGVL